MSTHLYRGTIAFDGDPSDSIFNKPVDEETRKRRVAATAKWRAKNIDKFRQINAANKRAHRAREAKAKEISQ
jgi:hypothetical protein